MEPKNNMLNVKSENSNIQPKEKYAKVYTIVSGKGGVGKTTICANLGMALALLGKKVLLIDGDIGLKNLDVLMGLEEYCTYDIIDCLNNKVKFSSAVVQDPSVSSLYVISTSQSLDKSSITPKQIGMFCHDLMKEFDYIFIDAPSGIENGFLCSIAPATHAIIVVTLEHNAIRNSDRIIGIMESHGLLPKNMSVIINKIDTHLLNEGVLIDPDTVSKTLSLPVIAQIPLDDDIMVSNFKKRPVVLNGRAFITKIFINIAKMLDGENVEPIIIKKLSFFDKILNMIFLRK